MEHSINSQFFSEIIRMVSRGYGDRIQKNPVVEFTRKAKSGEYDAMSDEDYQRLLLIMEDLSYMWLDQPEQTNLRILRIILENADFTKKQADAIGEIMAGAYSARKIKGLTTRTVQKLLDERPSCSSEAEKTEPVTSSGTDGSTGSQDSETPECSEEDFLDEMLDLPDLDCEQLADRTNLTPQEIYNFLGEHIYKQDQAKRVAAMMLWNHMRGNRRNILFAGPTGCGKTEIFRQLQKLYHNIIIADGSRITQDGWKGNYKFSTIFQGISDEEASHSIVVIDEADKMFEPEVASSGTDYSYAIQNELLKMIEGDVVKLSGDKENTVRTLDTSGISFVFMGSFETMVKSRDHSSHSLGFGAAMKEKGESSYNERFTPDDLVKYANVRREIAGRIDEIVQLQPMTGDDYYRIMETDSMSPIRMLEKRYHVTIDMPEESKQALCRDAAASGMGVRYLRSRIQTQLDEAMFRNEHADRYELVYPAV